MPSAAASLAPIAKLTTIAGPVGIALGAVAVAATAAVAGVRLFGAAVQKQTQQLEGYSAAVSMAVSHSDLRRELATMRRAQRIGPEVAKLENIRGRFDAQMMDIGTEIREVFVKWVVKYEKDIEALLAAIVALGPVIKAATSVAIPLLQSQTGVLGALASNAAKIRELMARWFGWQQNQANEDLGADVFLDEFFNALPDRLAQDRRAPPPAANGRPANWHNPHAGNVPAHIRQRAAAQAQAAGGGP